jgi:hypothetical protein
MSDSNRRKNGGVFSPRMTISSPRVSVRWSVNEAIADAVGGLAGSPAMNYTQRPWTLVVDRNAPPSAAGLDDARDWQERTESQNSNEIAAQVLARITIDRALSERELSIAATLVHFSFGAAVGAIYSAYLGTVSHKGRASHGRGAGAAFGGLVGGRRTRDAAPWSVTLDTPASSRNALSITGRPLVYGVVTERVRRVTPRALGGGRALR